MKGDRLVLIRCVILPVLPLFLTCCATTPDSGTGTSQETKAASKNVSENRKTSQDRYYTKRLISKGGKLSAEEAEALETTLANDPKNLEAHTTLLGYYSKLSRHSESARAKKCDHALWIIEHHPESDAARLRSTRPSKYRSPESYAMGKSLWEQHLKADGKNSIILWNAAEFFFTSDSEKSLQLLQRGEKLEPENPRWPNRAGWHHELDLHHAPYTSRQKISAKSLKAYERAYSLSEEMEQIELLAELAAAAYSAGNLKKAKSYSAELLEKTEPDQWDAQHAGHIILGLVALKSGEIEGAKDYLLKAANPKGADKYDSPNMALAKGLLEKKEKAIVLEYLDLCAKFWNPKRSKVDEWKAEITDGHFPDFSRYLYSF